MALSHACLREINRLKRSHAHQIELWGHEINMFLINFVTSLEHCLFVIMVKSINYNSKTSNTLFSLKRSLGKRINEEEEGRERELTYNMNSEGNSNGGTVLRQENITPILSLIIQSGDNDLVINH